MIGNGHKRNDDQDLDFLNEERIKSGVTDDVKKSEYIDLSFNINHDKLIKTVTSLSEKAMLISRRYDYNAIEELRELRNKLTYHLLSLSKLQGQYFQQFKMTSTKRKILYFEIEKEFLGKTNENTNRKYSSVAAKTEAENDERITKLREEESYNESMYNFLRALKDTVSTTVQTLNQDFSWMKDVYKRGEILND